MPSASAAASSAGARCTSTLRASVAPAAAALAATAHPTQVSRRLGQRVHVSFMIGSQIEGTFQAAASVATLWARRHAVTPSQFHVCSDMVHGLLHVAHNSFIVSCLSAAGRDTDGTTIFVKGFSREFGGEDEVRQALTEAFADCGEVSQVGLVPGDTLRASLTAASDPGAC